MLKALHLLAHVMHLVLQVLKLVALFLIVEPLLLGLIL